MVFTKLEPQKPSIKRDNAAKGEVSAILGLCGDLEKNGTRVHIKQCLLSLFLMTLILKLLVQC